MSDTFRWQRYWAQAEDWFRLRAFYTAYEKLYLEQKSMSVRFCQAIVFSAKRIPNQHRRTIVLLYFAKVHNKFNRPIVERYGLEALIAESRLLAQTGILEETIPNQITEDDYAPSQT